MTKLQIESVVEGLTAISLNFSLEPSEKYQEFVFKQLENKLTDEEFKQAVDKILSSEETFFNKMPPVATFIKLAGKQELSLEQQAKIQVERIIEYAKGYISGLVIFDNEITNAVAKDYGIGYIHNQLNNEWLDYRKGESTIKRELVDKWLTYHFDNKKLSDPIKIDNDSRNINMVGNKAVCKQLMEQPKQIEQVINIENQEKINLILTKITKTVGTGAFLQEKLPTNLSFDTEFQKLLNEAENDKTN